MVLRTGVSGVFNRNQKGAGNRPFQRAIIPAMLSCQGTGDCKSHRLLLNKSYNPCPVKRVEITKDNGGTRNLGQQMQMAERLKKIEGKRIPPDFAYNSVNGLSREVLSKLQEVRPSNLGQASRIPGITPAAISLLMVAIERLKRERDKRAS
jgi:hypothetical protein